MKSWMFYDCEIAKLIPPRNGDRLKGYEFCSGWNDFQGMGISVIGAYSATTDTFEHFLPHHPMFTPFAFEHVCRQHDVVIGFNSTQFDDHLCRANGIKIQTDYDLLNEIRKAAYGSAQWEHQPTGYRYNLDSIARANGLAKTGSGELAPKLWQDGKHEAVRDCCLNDVKISVALLKLGWKGKLIDPNTGKYLQLPTLE